MKWTKYIQKETLARGAKNQCPRMYLVGSWLHPKIELKQHMKTPIRKNTLNKP